MRKKFVVIKIIYPTKVGVYNHIVIIVMICYDATCVTLWYLLEFLYTSKGTNEELYKIKTTIKVRITIGKLVGGRGTLGSVSGLFFKLYISRSYNYGAL